MPRTRLTRRESDRIFAGVCGGLGAYLGVDTVFVRLAFLLLIFASGIGILLYGILMIFMPDETDIGRSPSEIAEANLSRLGGDIASGVEKMRRHPRGPSIAAGFLILLGFYLLFNNMGWLNWLGDAWIWTVAIIGLGFYLILRRRGS